MAKTVRHQTGVEREVGEQASEHASKKARRQARQKQQQHVHDVQQMGKHAVKAMRHAVR